MKLNIRAIACTQTVTAAPLFAVCSFFAGSLPDQSLRFVRSMRPLSIGGFIVGLLVTSLGW